MAELRRYDLAIQCLLPSLLLHGWECRKDQREPLPGDLVMLQSAPLSEWHLSLYKEAGEGAGLCQKHLLESLKAGNLCWWENVGFIILDREKAGLGRMLEWDDDQFAFDDQFKKVCRKADFYIAIPFIDEFDGDYVLLKFRTRYGINDRITTLPPFPWRKATQKALRAFLCEWEETHKAAKPVEAPSAPEGGSHG